MAGPRDQAPDRVLLIGIDHYLPGRTPAGISYPCLEGAVRDVEWMERFLVDSLGVCPSRIHKLTASGPSAGRRDRELPTYENMVAAFTRLIEEAEPRDRVLIHYSGHGGRARTRFPKVKGEHGWDEVLVPTNVGDQTARYLRDVELAYLLRKMVARELLLTLILDCCHAGGAIRNGHLRRGATPRGVGLIDTSDCPQGSLVARHEELEQTWRQLTAWTSRGVEVASGWLPEPRGYVLLAACLAHELAFEYAFDGRHQHGVLSYRLLEALEHLGTGHTYKRLFDRVVAKVRGDFEDQTPQLEGEADRLLFSERRGRCVDAVNVLRTDPVRRRLLLHTGRAQGVESGARFAVYPLGVEPRESDPDPPLVVKLDELGATESWAVPVRGGLEAAEPGSQAVLIAVGSIRLRRAVRLAERDGLAAVRRALERRGSGFVELVSDATEVDFEVTIDASGAYSILDPAGRPLPDQRPPVHPGELRAGDRMAARIVHLAKFRNVVELVNPDELSPLVGKLQLEFYRPGPDGRISELLRPGAENPDQPPELKVGEMLGIKVKNTSEQPLHVSVLDLQPGWSVAQIHPIRKLGDSVVVEPGGEELVRLRAELPGGCDAGVDQVKVFATVEASQMRWLELPPLGERIRIFRGTPKNRFEELLATLVTEGPKVRALEPGGCGEWTVEQRKIRIVRR
ncbi:MAG: caspase family protein [bacterium]|nr:caspase family protein [bacterium]